MSMYVFGCKAMSDLRKEVVYGTADINGQEKPPRVDQRIKMGKIRSEGFGDGSPKSYIVNSKKLLGSHAVYLSSIIFDPPPELKIGRESIFRQYSEAFEIIDAGVESFLFILPYHPTGQMERGRPGEVRTGLTLSFLLSTLQMVCSSTKVTFVVFDIHEPTIPSFFRFAICKDSPFMPNFLDQLDPKEHVIVYPDGGARKQFGSLVEERGFDFVVCHKNNHQDAEINIVEGNPAGKHCVMIDDIVQSGNTNVNCAHALLDAGASAVSTCATHAVLPNGAASRLIEGPFTNVWLSNTVPHASRLDGKGPIKVVSVADKIRGLIQYIMKKRIS